MGTRIVIAGATGNLGGRIAAHLMTRGAEVTAIVRPSSDREKVDALRRRGVRIVSIGLGEAAPLVEACRGASCVVSALAGLRDAIVDGQTALVEAAVAAGCPRFVPSDFSIDFTRLPAGNNRSLDLRREMRARLEGAPIAATSIFNGMFSELLTGEAPFVLFRLHRVLYWGDADRTMDFTTIDDTAAFTAAAAMDPAAPRDLRIAGDSLGARELAEVASEVTGARFRLLRGGSLKRLDRLIRIARALAPGRGELYPAWQGMQYMRDMYDGRGKLSPLDVDRYAGIRWTRVREVLATRVRAARVPAPA